MKFISHIIKTVVLISMLFTLLGCSDDGAANFPFWITAHESTIDLRGGSGEDGISMISTTIFDDQGAPVEDGTMFFTLNYDSRGYFVDEEGTPNRSLSVDIDDGVAEAVFQSTLAPETVIVKAYCPRYPSDSTVRTSITVLNDTSLASFNYTDMGEQIVNFYDLSGFPSGTLATVTWAWNFGDATTSTLRDPSHEYAVAGTYDVTLTINATSSVTYTIVVD